MKITFAFILLTGALGTFAPGQTPASPRSPICGEGKMVVRIGTTQLGTETFQIDCLGDGGYSGRGTTDLDLGGAKLHLETAIVTDAKSVPLKYSVKGNAFNSPVETSMVLSNGTATVTESGKTSTLTYPPNVAMLTNNVSYLFQFIVGRYDFAQGGTQEVIFLPNVKASLTFVLRESVSPKAKDGGPVEFNRFLLKLGAVNISIWTDGAGRLALVGQPDQKFAAVREEYLAYADALMSLVAAATPKLDYSAPANASFTAEEVTVQAKGHTLAGTLLLPKNAKGRVPAVITISGSGSQTRDEPMPYPNLKNFRPFRQIAEALAGRGIAVLRVDDRGVGDSTGVEGINNATTFDFADDTRAQIAFLRARKEIDPARIALVGHSEGGIIAPMVAVGDPQLAAIALLAGTGQRGDQVLLYQFNREIDLSPTLSDEAKAKARDENARMIRVTVEGGDTSTFPLILRFPWTKAFLAYDPVPAMRKVRQPVLILQGGLDRQVVPENAELLRTVAVEGGNRKVEVQVFPTLNHLFLPAKTGDESEYAEITVQELPAEFMDTLTNWLVAALKVR
jgi:dienelactone hydrolase